MIQSTSDVAQEGQLVAQTTPLAEALRESKLNKVLADLLLIKNESLRETVTEHVTSIYDVKTPKEKIKKRPDGFDYVESTWMDKTFKGWSPLYKFTLVHVNETLGWIDIIVSLEDRITGNVELGAGSARIQVRRNTVEPYQASDIVDKGNNLKAALTNACKNAQSKFGTSADVYGKRESIRTPDEISRFNQMLSTVKRMNPARAKMFEDTWHGLGVDFTEFLDQWQVYIDRFAPEAAKDKSLFKSQDNQVSNAADTKSNKIESQELIHAVSFLLM